MTINDEDEAIIYVLGHEVSHYLGWTGQIPANGRSYDGITSTSEIEAREFGKAAVASYRINTRNVTATSHASVTVADTPQCAECGRVLSTAKRPHKFCSDGCRWTFHNRMRRQRRAAGRTKSCVVGGTEFTATRSDASTCSHACKQKAYRQRTRASYLGSGG